MFACSKCENTYTAERNLMRHIETKHGDKPNHICTLCEKQVERIDVLQKHLKYIHNIDHKKTVLPGFGNDDNYFECHVCKRTFKEKFNLNRHLETTHHDNCGEYECQTCGKLFKRKDHLKRHTETHIKIVCEICLKQFKSKDGLKAHRIGNHES